MYLGAGEGDKAGYFNTANRKKEEQESHTRVLSTSVLDEKVGSTNVKATKPTVKSQHMGSEVVIAYETDAKDFILSESSFLFFVFLFFSMSRFAG